MRNGILGCLTLFLAGTGGLALAQVPPAATVPPASAAPAPTATPLSRFVEDKEHAEKEHGEEKHAEEAHEEEHHEEEEAPHPARVWARAEYLLWWIRNSNLPPLVTTGSPNDIRPGALGQPGTQVQFGFANQDNSDRSGGRFTVGGWLDCEEAFGLEASGFFLASRAVSANLSGTGVAGSTTVIARPFFDVVNQRDDSELVVFPGVVGGAVSVASRSSMYGAEFNGVANLWCGCHGRLDALVGFRFLHLDEDVSVLESSVVQATSPIVPGNVIGVADSFSTRDWFYGGQLGVRATVSWKRWDAEFVAKVALGDTHEVVDIAGSTAIVIPGATRTVTPSGLLALATNSGHYSRDVFGVVPEVGVNLAYRITDHFRAFAGYTFLYWSDVARPGDNIDRFLNPRAIPTSQLAGAGGPARPAFTFADTGFWAQGVNFGFEFRY